MSIGAIVTRGFYNNSIPLAVTMGYTIGEDLGPWTDKPLVSTSWGDKAQVSTTWNNQASVNTIWTDKT